MKRLVIEIDETLHKAIRSTAFKQEKSMKQFVTEVLKAEIKKSDCK
jgi:predicted HicB family RNase H-like nuclease